MHNSDFTQVFLCHFLSQLRPSSPHSANFNRLDETSERQGSKKGRPNKSKLFWVSKMSCKTFTGPTFESLCFGHYWFTYALFGTFKFYLVSRMNLRSKNQGVIVNLERSLEVTKLALKATTANIQILKLPPQKNYCLLPPLHMRRVYCILLFANPNLISCAAIIQMLRSMAPSILNTI